MVTLGGGATLSFGGGPPGNGRGPAGTGAIGAPGIMAGPRMYGLGASIPGVFGASRSMLPMRTISSTLPRRWASCTGSTPGSRRVETISSDPQFQDLATAGPDEIVSTRLNPGHGT